MSNMMDDLPGKSLPALGQILEALQEQAVRDEVERTRLEHAFANLQARERTRAQQIRLVTDELTRRNPPT